MLAAHAVPSTSTWPPLSMPEQDVGAPIDANGNLTSDGTRIFEWNARNQLVAVNVGVNRSEFSYDGLQRRVRVVEKENGVTQSDSKVVWCEKGICEERAADGATVTRRACERGEQVAGAARFFAADHLGSVTEVADGTAALLARYGFGPWGSRTLTAGTDITSVGFTGHRWHSNGTGWLTQYRFHDPATGRWASEDPLLWIDTPDLYAYVGNNPLNYTDPSGEAAVKNNSGRQIPVKPENGGELRLCPPGQTCDVDGVYPPECKDYPVKIVDGCTGEVTPDGKLKIVCPLFNRNAHGLAKFPRFGQMATGGRTNRDFHEKHKDWPPPNGQPNCGCKAPY